MALYKAIPKSEIYPADKFNNITRIVYGSNTCLFQLGVVPNLVFDKSIKPLYKSLGGFKPFQGPEKYQELESIAEDCGDGELNLISYSDNIYVTGKMLNPNNKKYQKVWLSFDISSSENGARVSDAIYLMH